MRRETPLLRQDISCDAVSNTEESTCFHSFGEKQLCLPRLMLTPGFEIPIFRWVGSAGTKGNPGGCYKAPIRREVRCDKTGLSCRSPLPANERVRETFLRYRRGQEVYPRVAGPRRFIRRSDNFVDSTFLSCQHRDGNGELGFGMGSHHNPTPCRTLSEAAGKRVVDRVRLRCMASHVPHWCSFLHRSTAAS